MKRFVVGAVVAALLVGCSPSRIAADGEIAARTKCHEGAYRDGIATIAYVPGTGVVYACRGESTIYYADWNR